MPNTRCSAILSVDGYEVSASFANQKNTAVINQVKQILLSSFASSSKPQPGDILVIHPEQSDNNGRGKPYAPCYENKNP